MKLVVKKTSAARRTEKIAKRDGRVVATVDAVDLGCMVKEAPCCAKKCAVQVSLPEHLAARHRIAGALSVAMHGLATVRIPRG
jgi:hypothetical protein